MNAMTVALLMLAQIQGKALEEHLINRYTFGGSLQGRVCGNAGVLDGRLVCTMMEISQLCSSIYLNRFWTMAQVSFLIR